MHVPVGWPSPLPQVGPLKLVDEQSHRNRFQPSVHVPPFMQGCDSHCGGRTWHAGRMAPTIGSRCKLYKLESRRHFHSLSLSLSSLGRHFNYSLLFSLSLSSVFIRPLSIRPTSHPKNFSPHLLATEAVPYQSLAEENLRVVVVSFSQSASGPAIDFPPATTMRIRTQGK